MSIAVACNVPDGVVLGADSAITVPAPGGVAKVFEDAEKVFPLCPRGRDLTACLVGAVTYGLGVLGSRTVEAYVREFCDGEAGSEVSASSVEQVSRSISKWFADQYNGEVRPALERELGMPFEKIPPQQIRRLGFAVAGYSAGGHSPEVWHAQIPSVAGSEELRRYKAPGEFGVSWWGVIHPVTRFIKGFDPGLLDQVIGHLARQHEFEVQQAEAKEIAELIKAGEYQIPYGAMSLQEAVNLTKFLLSLAVNFAHFAVGAPVCGGPIRVAVISKADGFGWVQRPKLEVRLV